MVKRTVTCFSLRLKEEKIHSMEKPIASPKLHWVNIALIVCFFEYQWIFPKVLWTLLHFFCELFLSLVLFATGVSLLSYSFAKSSFSIRHIDFIHLFIFGLPCFLQMFSPISFAFLIFAMRLLLYVWFQFFTVSQTSLSLSLWFLPVFVLRKSLSSWRATKQGLLYPLIWSMTSRRDLSHLRERIGNSL